MKKTFALLLALCMALMLAACGGAPAAENNSAANDDANANEAEDAVVVNDEAASAGDELGFEEIPIFEDEEISFINVNAVYFQPVPMTPGMENFEDYDLHLECDVSAMENNLGYGVGDWIPYLTIDYRIIDSNGADAASGTLMNMAASDGPHYGANVILPNAGTYSLEFTIHSPAENGYMVHSDAETGPGGLLEDPEYWGNGNLVLYVENCWDYIPQEW